jgi:NADPH:quinone reductase-like Zn-dependent oxidoreductase
MRAWTHNVRGAPASVLKLTELPAPVIDANKSTEVLVRISNAALNPGGSIMMHLAPFLFRHSPAIPEMDFTGTIVSSGCGDLEPGTEVFGSILVPRHLGTGSGALAEYVVVGKENVVRRPMGVKAEEAAGLGVAGCTALVCVFFPLEFFVVRYLT